MSTRAHFQESVDRFVTPPADDAWQMVTDDAYFTGTRGDGELAEWAVEMRLYDETEPAHTYDVWIRDTAGQISKQRVYVDFEPTFCAGCITEGGHS